MDQKKPAYYPLTFAQKLHLFTVKYCPRKEILNIGISFTIEGEIIDFDMLRKAIVLACERTETMRLRFHEKENGEVYQYLAPPTEINVEYVDFLGRTQQEAEDELQRWTTTPFERQDSQMNRVVMVNMPDGYKGVYLNVDHMTMDSFAIIVFCKDVIELYCHMKYEFDYPKPLAPYLETLEKDLEYEKGSKSLEEDRAFWQSFIERSEPLFADIIGDRRLREQREELGNPKLRAVGITSEDVEAHHEQFHLEGEPTKRILQFCMDYRVSMVCLLILGVRTYLSKMNDCQEDISIKSTISRRGNLQKKKSGGTRIHFFPCRTILPPETTFLEALHIIQRSQFELFRHADFDPVEFMMMQAQHYGLLPGQSHECMSLTYQPMTMKADDMMPADIKYKSKWYSNGVAACPLYLTVMHNPVDKGLDFYYEYQTGRVNFEELEHMYYYLCRILFKGIENPEMTVGEIMEQV